MRVYQLINDNNNPAANQFVIEHEGKTYFQSYDTLIAVKDGDNITISEDWDYSNTTRKHFYIFLRDYCGACGTLRKKDIEYEIAQGNYKLVDKINF